MNSVGTTQSPGFLGVMLSGVRLRCPSCCEAPMGEGRRLNETCARCGWQFFRVGDGDWLVTWLIAYTVAAVVMLIAWPILHFTIDLGLMVEMAVLATLGALTVAALFPNCRGASAALLYFLRVRWKE